VEVVPLGEAGIQANHMNAMLMHLPLSGLWGVIELKKRQCREHYSRVIIAEVD
jgi:hypothetical protein